MINKVLLEIAHLYYPADVCPWNEKEKYMQALEYRRLQTTIDYFNSDANLTIRKNIINEFGNDGILKDFEDFSRLDSNQDRCYTFFLNVVEGGEMYSISLLISILIPYYVIRKEWQPAEPFFTKAGIEELERQKSDKRTIDKLILDIETIVEEKLLYKKFPSALMNNLIADVSFGDVYLGYFTMFNAFFNNSTIHENDN